MQYKVFCYYRPFLAIIKNNKIVEVKTTNKKCEISLDKLLEMYEPNLYYPYNLLYEYMKEKRLYFYKELANLLKMHPRKIGLILKKNPLPIIIPCHRVIKSNYNIGGYKFGIELKKYLLIQEKLCSEIKNGYCKPKA